MNWLTIITTLLSFFTSKKSGASGRLLDEETERGK